VSATEVGVDKNDAACGDVASFVEIGDEASADDEKL
jgi:hypothetical protein